MIYEDYRLEIANEADWHIFFTYILPRAIWLHQYNRDVHWNVLVEEISQELNVKINLPLAPELALYLEILNGSPLYQLQD